MLQVPKSTSSGLQRNRYRAFFLFSCTEVTIGSIVLTISVYVGGSETDQLLSSAHLRRTIDGSQKSLSSFFRRSKVEFAQVLYIWLIVKGTKSASQSMRALPSVILKIGHELRASQSILEELCFALRLRCELHAVCTCPKRSPAYSTRVAFRFLGRHRL